MWFHPQTPFHRLSRPVTEALYRDVPAIVVYGEHVKRVLLEVPGVDARRSSWPGRRWMLALRARCSRPATAAPVVLFIGQFEERKGIDDLLEAFDKVPDPDAELRLVGNGSLEEHIRAADQRPLAGDDRRPRSPGRPARPTGACDAASCCPR